MKHLHSTQDPTWSENATSRVRRELNKVIIMSKRLIQNRLPVRCRTVGDLMAAETPQNKCWKSQATWGAALTSPASNSMLQPHLWQSHRPFINETNLWALNLFWFEFIKSFYWGEVSSHALIKEPKLCAPVILTGHSASSPWKNFNFFCTNPTWGQCCREESKLRWTPQGGSRSSFNDWRLRFKKGFLKQTKETPLLRHFA